MTASTARRGGVTDDLYANGSCTGTAAFTTSDVVPGTPPDSTVPDSSTTAPLGTGIYSYQATYTGDSNYSGPTASDCEVFAVNRPPRRSPSRTCPPVGPWRVTAHVTTSGDGTSFSVTSTSAACTVGGDGLTVTYAGVGTCSLTAHVAATTNYTAASDPQTPFNIGQATPTVTISNLPTSGPFGGGFTADVTTSGDGTSFSVTSTSASAARSGPTA